MAGVFGIPLIAGATIGLLARQQPVVSNIIGSISVLPIYLVIMMFQLKAIEPGGWRSSLWFAVNPFLLWLPISSATAAVAAQIRKLSQLRYIARQE